MGRATNPNAQYKSGWFTKWAEENTNTDFVNVDQQGNYIGGYTPPPKVNEPPNKPPVPAGPTSVTTLKEIFPNDDSKDINQGTYAVDVFDGSSALQNPITPSPNILDQYATYTYSITWYMLSPAQYNQVVNTGGKVDFNGWSLLVQSGGANTQPDSAAPKQPTLVPYGRLTNNEKTTSGRNKYFDNDYYLDNLMIKSTFKPGGVPNATELKFNVYEPNGITLLKNLALAAVELTNGDSQTYQTIPMAIVIRFYGWDEQGNLVTKLKQAPGSPAQLPNDYNAAAIKYIPFKVKDFKFAMVGKNIEYTIEGTPFTTMYGLGQTLGTIPNTAELTGQTVDDLCNGRAFEKTVTTTAVDGRQSTNTPSKKTGPLENVQFTGQASNLTTSNGMDFSSISGFGA